MASEVEICNLALAHFGSRSNISSLTEASEEARHCRLHYANIRDSLLQMLDWDFARRYTFLATLDETAPGDWLYAFALPADCITPRDVVTSSPTPVPYVVGLGVTLTPVLWCDQATVELRYTRRETNSGAFSPQHAHFPPSRSMVVHFNCLRFSRIDASRFSRLR
jgi:hypothetical protein